MNFKLRKKFLAVMYPIVVLYKKTFYQKSGVNMSNSLAELLEGYKNKKKIVVFCSGPSANKVEINSEHLYLATNDGYKRMLNENVDYLLYLNDQFCVNRILANNSFYKKNQKILFYYSDSDLHIKGWNYLKNKLFLLGEKPLFFILNNAEYEISYKNFVEFHDFYKDKNLPVKVQNSGMFLLLLGFYISDQLKLPLEIYGLDLGVGGNVHFDSPVPAGTSVTRDRVKVNVKMYLDFIYSNHFEVKNYSNFYGNQ